MNAALACRGVAVTLSGRTVLSDVDAVVNGGELLGVIGPNGSGKSTLLRVLAGLQRAVRGEVTLDGRRLEELSRRDAKVGHFKAPAEIEPQVAGEHVQVLLVKRRVEIVFRQQIALDRRIDFSLAGKWAARHRVHQQERHREHRPQRDQHPK
jgi:ABC-type Mn2+/Zn2+ transport system ATPase subunit